MDFLEIIGTIIEFSKKQEEFSDEIKTIRATLTSLQIIMRQVDQHNLPDHITIMLDENLKDAQELLQSASDKNKNTWWTSLKNMLPGSDLQKVKEKNQQLIHVINLLNLHLNTIRKGKRVLSSVSFPKDEEESEELNEEPQKRLKTSMSRHSFSDNKENVPERDIKSLRKSFSNFKFSYSKKSSTEATQISEELPNPQRPIEEIKIEEEEEEEDIHHDKKPAFRLKVLYNKDLAKRLSSYPKVKPYIAKYWPNKEESEEVAYNFQRTKYMYLPDKEMQKLSRDHAMLIAKRRPKKRMISTQDLQGPTQDEQEDSWVTTNRVLFMCTQLDEGQNEESNGGVQGEVEYEYKYVLKDSSLNGTFFVRTFDKKEIDCGTDGVTIEGDFTWLKGEEVSLSHGDVIGLITNKPECTEVIFGFQFLLTGKGN